MTRALETGFLALVTPLLGSNMALRIGKYGYYRNDGKRVSHASKASRQSYGFWLGSSPTKNHFVLRLDCVHLPQIELEVFGSASQIKWKALYQRRARPEPRRSTLKHEKRNESISRLTLHFADGLTLKFALFGLENVRNPQKS